MILRPHLEYTHGVPRRPLAQGFVAKPRTLEDGTQDSLYWECVVPAKTNSLWEAGRYPVTMCVRCGECASSRYISLVYRLVSLMALNKF